MPNDTPQKPLLVVRTICTTCKQYHPCSCYTARMQGAAQREAVEREDATAKEKSARTSALTNAVRAARRTGERT